MEIEKIITKNIQVELSRIRMLLFVIAFILILEFLLQKCCVQSNHRHLKFDYVVVIHSHWVNPYMDFFNKK